ncbi:hypothetical protein E1293_09840 [Actinomadura darangshiensis]|uniref:TfoX N-terminal domain-containing protein n=1 Tax=Actinomadura darangshiensis TaxID=705336 RepID=A0A4R5BQ54_9ACTN|nr:TfoX/Sxy family protein [Actinomadura darangshiensis]TDD86182.1 hypothetical protein E1293_09840 [Actinomadura darangshiensis]
MTPEERFEDLVDAMTGRPGVSPPGSTGRGGFGSHALRIEARMFAMLVRGRLVLKLPETRVDELVAAGEGIRFDANKGTPMREWLALDPEAETGWVPLAEEAMEFVRPGPGTRR